MDVRRYKDYAAVIALVVQAFSIIWFLADRNALINKIAESQQTMAETQQHLINRVHKLENRVAILEERTRPLQRTKLSMRGIPPTPSAPEVTHCSNEYAIRPSLLSVNKTLRGVYVSSTG